MEKIIKEGKELEEILNDICNEYNLTRNDFYYTYTTKKNGIFNKSNNIILTGYLKSELTEYIKNYLQELLTNMGLVITIESKSDETAIIIKVFSNNNSVLIGKNGNTLKSLEMIVKQKINTEFGIRPYINIDIENYRENQQKRLESLAKKLAKEVNNTKVEVHLENMNAYDRRIIHNVLSNFKGVKTTSEGEEPNRHVVIKPE